MELVSEYYIQENIMNIDVSKSFFESVKSDFLSLDCSVLDEKIQDVISRWKTSPLLNSVCPRWSCQSHSDKSNDSSYEIIFVTTNGGYEHLYQIYQMLVSEIVHREGIMRLASCDFSIINLCKPDFIQPEPHIRIGIIANGNPYTIVKCMTAWNSVLNRVESEFE